MTYTANAACTVNDAGTSVNLTHAGTCSVVAHQAGNADYNPAPEATQTVTVAKGEQHITFQLPANAKVGDTLALTATGGASGNPVTYTANAACTVNDAGTSVNLTHAGTCSVVAHQAGNADYTAASEVSQTVAVAKGEQKITFTAPAKATVGGSDTLSATSTSGLPVTITSSTSSCTVSGVKVTYNHALACTLVAKQAGNDDYIAAPDVTQTVAVAKGDQTISFTSTPPSPALVNGTYAVAATGGPSGKQVTFGSATPNVCSVAGSTVKFLAAGSCSLTANQVGNDDYNAAPQATQSVTISVPHRDLTMNITQRPGFLFGIFGTLVDVQVLGLDPGAHATLQMSTHHLLAFSPGSCDANDANTHSECTVTSTPTTFTFLAFSLGSDPSLEFEVRSNDSVDSNPGNNKQTVDLGN